MMKKFFVFIALSALVIGCKKNDDNGSQPCPIKQSTIAGRYVITAIKYKASSTAAEQDMYSAMADCEKDDIFELRKDSSVILSSGTLVCPGPPPPGGISVWYVSADGKKFTLDAEYDINSFDCTNLEVTQKDFFASGDTRTVTFSKN